MIIELLVVIFIFSCILFGLVAIFTSSLKFLIGTFISIILICVCAYISPLINKDPSKLYQEKIEAVEKANKELEKFLIDYPEFKEEYNYD